MWFGVNEDLLVGDRVRAQDRRGAWRAGVLSRAHRDGSFDVECEDGTSLGSVPAQQLRMEPNYPNFEAHATLQQQPWDDNGAAENLNVQYSAREDQALPARPHQAEAPPQPPQLPPRGEGGWSDGARVSADYCGLGYYHEATVSGINQNGTYTLRYDDGLIEEHVPAARMTYPGGPPAAKPAAPSKPVEPPRRRAATPPQRSRQPAPAAAEALGPGSKAQGNWRALGYWHPCTVVALLAGGAFRLLYEDGFEEDAPAEFVLPAGAAPCGAFGDGRGSDRLGGGGFGQAAVARGGDESNRNPLSRRQSEGAMGKAADGPNNDGGLTPLAPRRRRASGVHDAEKVRRQFEQERKARLEVVKVRPEDRRWAEQHGMQGDKGLFQGMIVRFRNGMPPAPPLQPPNADAPISVFVRCRPLLDFERKAGGFEVVTPATSEVGSSLVMHEPKTMVDLSKAMDNHTYRFDGVFGEAASNAQIFDTALRPMVRHLFGARGGHGTCFAYGQTGSGKTVTMEGLGDKAINPDNAYGLYSLVADELFRCLAQEAQRGVELVVRAGFVEIYRGKCFDLRKPRDRLSKASAVPRLPSRPRALDAPPSHRLRLLPTLPSHWVPPHPAFGCRPSQPLLRSRHKAPMTPPPHHEASRALLRLSFSQLIL